MCCFSTLAAEHSGAWPPHTFAPYPALTLLGGLQCSNSPYKSDPRLTHAQAEFVTWLVNVNNVHKVPGFPSPAVVSRSPALAAKSQPLNSSATISTRHGYQPSWPPQGMAISPHGHHKA